MTPAIAALAAIFLLVGTASAQEPGSAGGNPGAAGVQASPVPGKPERPNGSPKLRDQLLQGAINELLRPRPRAKPSEPAPAPVEAAVTTAAPVPAEIPRGVAPQPVAPTPQPAPAVLQLDPVTPVLPQRPPTAAPAAPVILPPPAAPAVPALRAEPDEVAPTAEAPPPIAPLPPPSEAAQTPNLAPQPAAPLPGSSLWWLAGLVAAAAAAAIAIGTQRARRIGKTRAMLSLHPSLDLTDGACTVSGLALAGPPLSIRTRLDLGEA